MIRALLYFVTPIAGAAAIAFVGYAAQVTIAWILLGIIVASLVDVAIQVWRDPDA